MLVRGASVHRIAKPLRAISSQGLFASLGFLLLLSRYSAQNAPVEAQANRDMTGAILEYARGLAVVKSFGRDIPLEHFDIAFDHVSFGYDDRQVLHDVSFTIPEKTSTAIVGPSSSGKTTLCFAVQRAEDLLRKVERVVFALLVGQARIKSKIFQRQGIFLCQRAGGSWGIPLSSWTMERGVLWGHSASPGKAAVQFSGGGQQLSRTMS